MMYAGKQRNKQNDGAQKAKNKKYVLKRLWDYLTFYKAKLIVAIGLTVVANLLSLVGPFLTGRIVNAMEDGVKFDQVFFFAGLMIVFYLISATMNYFLSIAMVRISQSVVYKMRKDVFKKLTEVPISYFDTNQTGDIISKMSYDIDTINTSLATDVISIFTSLITVVISFVMMLIMSPILSLIFIMTIPLSFFFTKTLSKIVKKKYRQRNMKLGELNGFAEEMITGQKTIQSYVGEKRVLERFDQINDEASEASYKAGYYGTIVGPTVNFISNLSVTLVGVFGGILFFKGDIRLGTLTSFTLYSRRFSGPINQMSNIFADIQSALAAAERVFGLIDQKTEPNDQKDALVYDDVKGQIEFEHVHFSYDQKTPIIKDLSFYAEPGKVVAIVGPTGAGKTTLVNLLMRFYDIDNGQILADKVNITHYTRASLRRSFSMVLQDTWLFTGSIYENIAYGNGDVTHEDIVSAAKRAKIHDFIMALPEGYETVLSDEGLNISKGQKQLLVIARAMLSNTKMLILDEATSNVDTQTEIDIQQAMLKLMENKTSFVIAHRLSTIQNADWILVMRDGNIVEQGKHQDLMTQQGFYYKLYQAQFE
ncbi:MAG: ABC transporter ATP-binding protein [Acholeplasma sp.]|nr:ABC transporter ATP-binding protein [Acholeplasma sp.]